MRHEGQRRTWDELGWSEWQKKGSWKFSYVTLTSPRSCACSPRKRARRPIVRGSPCVSPSTWSSTGWTKWWQDEGSHRLPKDGQVPRHIQDRESKTTQE